MPIRIMLSLDFILRKLLKKRIVSAMPERLKTKVKKDILLKLKMFH
jgi:hypothetical protein